MTEREQVVLIPAGASSFSAVCERCEAADAADGYAGAAFAGRLDLDLPGGAFLCRRGHRIRVERAAPPAAEAAA